MNLNIKSWNTQRSRKNGSNNVQNKSQKLILKKWSNITFLNKVFIRKWCRDFPSGPVVKMVCFQCKVTSSIPSLGTKISHDSQWGQKKKWHRCSTNSRKWCNEQMRISRNRIHFLKTAEICQVEEHNKSHKIFAQRRVICYYSEKQKGKKIFKRVKKTQGTYGTSTRGSIYTLLEKRESLFEEIMAKTSYIWVKNWHRF